MVLKKHVVLHNSQNVNLYVYSEKFTETQTDKTLYLWGKIRFGFFSFFCKIKTVCNLYATRMQQSSHHIFSNMQQIKME